MENIRCLICANAADPQSNFVTSSLVQGQGSVDSVQVIALLHKLLQIPLWECAKYLNRPSNQWLHFCITCSQMVSQGRALVEQIERFQLQLQTLQATLQNQIVVDPIAPYHDGGGEVRNQLRDDIRRLSISSTIIVNNEIVPRRCVGRQPASKVVGNSSGTGFGHPVVDRMNLDILVDEFKSEEEMVQVVSGDDDGDPLGMVGNQQEDVELSSDDDDDNDDDENGDKWNDDPLYGSSASTTTRGRPKGSKNKHQREKKNVKPSRVPQDEDYKCFLCNEKLLNGRKLKFHFKLKHSDLAKGECPTCRKKFRDFYTLRRHFLSENVHAESALQII